MATRTLLDLFASHTRAWIRAESFVARSSFREPKSIGGRGWNDTVWKDSDPATFALVEQGRALLRAYKHSGCADCRREVRELKPRPSRRGGARGK